MNPILKYFILNSDKKPLFENVSGHVEAGEGATKTDGSSASLKHSPDGWNETLVKYARNNKWLGVFRDFSIPLNFVKDGALILRDAMWKKGIEAVYYLAIQKLDQNNFPDRYYNWYTGEFDFSKFKQTLDGVDIQLVEGGLTKLLKSNEATTYEIDIHNDAEKKILALDGLPFRNKVEWNVFEDQNIQGSNQYVGLGIISQEGTSQGVAVQDSPFDFIDTFPNEKWISNVISKTIPQTFVINIRVAVKLDCFVTVRMQKRSLSGTTTNYNIISGSYLAGQLIDQNITITVPMTDGDKLYVRAETPFLSTGSTWYTIESGSIKLEYDVTFDTTLCECLTWKRLGEKITEKLTGGKYGFKSSFLDSLDETQLLTSGQAIRKYGAPSVFKTSLSDFFKACQRWGVGMGIENDQLIIEKHEYFFRNDIAFELGEVSECEIFLAEDLVINTIKVGYQNQTYDNVNGKDEFNVTQQYSTPITRVVKELDLICPYRADMFGIELTRLKLFGKDTTDSSSDNDTFQANVSKGALYSVYNGGFTAELNTGNYFLKIPTTETLLNIGQVITISGVTHTVLSISFLIVGYSYVGITGVITPGSYNTSITVYNAEYYKLNRPAYSSITGLIFPDQAFNVELSPTHFFDGNGAYINSVLDTKGIGKIVFQTGEKNSVLSRTLGGVTTTENSDIPIFNLPAKLFLPYYASFKTKVDIDLPAIMRTNPYSKIAFYWLGLRITAYLWDGGFAPATDDSQGWKVLLAPDNDLTKLI